MDFEILFESIMTTGSKWTHWITTAITSNPNNALTYFWLIAAIVLLIMEVSIPGLFYFISFAMGSGIAALCAFFDYSIYVQCWCNVGASIVCLTALRLMLEKKTKTSTSINSSSDQETKSNVDALIGQQVLVTKTIEPRTPGRVKIKGEEWQALSVHGTSHHQGSVVTIVRVEGNKLIVM